MLVLCKTKYKSVEKHLEVECVEWIMVEALCPSDVWHAWKLRLSQLQRSWRAIRNPELLEYLPEHGRPLF